MAFAGATVLSRFQFMPLKSKPVRASRTQIADLMFPADANSRGTVFGGVVLKMVDKAASVCAYRHAGGACVTVAMERIEFRVPIYVGEFVVMESQVNFVGSTSMEIGVEVYAENLETGKRRHTNSCFVTMVSVNKDGSPKKVPGLLLETPEEKSRCREALLRRKQRLARP